jgi:Fic family protein
VAKQEATLRSNFDAEVAEPVINKAKDKLSHEETMVVDLLRDNPSVKNAQVAQVLGVSASKARNVLRSLTDKGLIEPSGQNKARIYTLVM